MIKTRAEKWLEWSFVPFFVWVIFAMISFALFEFGVESYANALLIGMPFLVGWIGGMIGAGIIALHQTFVNWRNRG